MTMRFLLATGALLAGLISGEAAAQSISAVASSNDQTADATISACVGSVLTIDGTGFGTAKPKVFLTNGDGKKFSLKVLTFSDVQITAQIKKASAGELTLNVQPKGVIDPVTSPVTIEAPAVGELQDPTNFDPITSADANAEFVIVGDYFGSKKGKIKIGGKAAKVLSWLDQEIHVIMPKTLANGLWDLVLDNKVALDPDTEIITTNSLAKVGKVSLTVTIGTGPGAETIHYKYKGNNSSPDYLAFGGTTIGYPLKIVGIVVFFDVNNTPVPSDISSADHALMTISYTKTVKTGPLQFAFANWLVIPGTAGLDVHITASGGGQCGGTFSADLPLTGDSIGGEPQTQHIEGEFVAEIP